MQAFNSFYLYLWPLLLKVSEGVWGSMCAWSFIQRSIVKLGKTAYIKHWITGKNTHTVTQLSQSLCSKLLALLNTGTEWIQNPDSSRGSCIMISGLGNLIYHCILLAWIYCFFIGELIPKVQTQQEDSTLGVFSLCRKGRLKAAEREAWWESLE